MRRVTIRLAFIAACLIPSLAIAERFESAAHAFRVTVVASGLDLPIPDDTFDLAYIQHVLHHIGDVDQAVLVRVAVELPAARGRVRIVGSAG